jgi:(2Fe-2S) ferredoxin
MQKTLIFCVNYRANPYQPSCAARGSQALVAACIAKINDLQLPIEVQTVHCFGACQDGPVLHQLPNNQFYYQVTVADLDAILQKAQQCNHLDLTGVAVAD